MIFFVLCFFLFDGGGGRGVEGGGDDWTNIFFWTWLETNAFGSFGRNFVWETTMWWYQCNLTCLPRINNLKSITLYS